MTSFNSVRMLRFLFLFARLTCLKGVCFGGVATIRGLGGVGFDGDGWRG